MSAFDIAVEENVDPQEWLEFTIGGNTCKALAQPTAGQVAYVTVMQSKHRGGGDARGMLNFLDSLLDEPTHDFLMEQVLLNPKVKDPEMVLMSVLENLIEQWSARPTELPSDSSARQETTGSSSIPEVPEPISSTSPSTDSATTSTDGSGIVFAQRTETV